MAKKQKPMSFCFPNGTSVAILSSDMSDLRQNSLW